MVDINDLLSCRDIPDEVVASVVMPNAQEAEQALLGALLMGQDAWDRVGHLITDADFYNGRHKLIFQSIARLVDGAVTPDVVSVAEDLERTSALEQAGGLAYLNTLAARPRVVSALEDHASIIRDRALLRGLIEASEQVRERAFRPGRYSGQDLISEAERLMSSLADRQFSDNGPSVVKDMLKEQLEQLERLIRNKGQLSGLTTGYKDLDEMTTGLQPGDLVIVAGRPSMGKCIVSGSTLVNPLTGGLRTIDKMVAEASGDVLSLNSDLRLERRTASHFVDDGQKPVFRVVTALGRTIETTVTHPFLTRQGWRPLGEIAVGDRVAVPRRLPVFGSHSIIRGELEALAGSIAEHEKQLPEFVFELPRTEMAFFLCHLFSCVGVVSANSFQQVSILFVGLAAASVRQVQHLLLRFGVLASLEVRQHLGQHLFELEVRDPPSLRVCLDEIGLPIQEADGQKVRNALEACPKSESEASDVYWDRVVSITSQGLKQVFDLTVPGLHNFVAQDVFVHNTTFAMNLVEHSLLNVETPKPAIVFSLEMPGQQLLRRMIASIGKVDSSKIRKGSLSTSDMKKIVGTVVPRLARLPLFIDETQGLTPGDMRSRIRRVVRDHGKPGIVMVDYLQLMEANEKLDNPVQKYSAISRDLKRIAREFEVPLVALSQLNRGLEQRPNKRPVNSDLRESGAIEQDADVIMFVYRDEVYHPDNEDNRGLAEIIIGKQRNGPIGTVKLAFQHSYTRFDNLAPQRIASDYPEMGS